MTTSVTPPPSPVRAYLDHAATTPMLPEAIEVLTAQSGRLGNPSSLHASGRAVRRVLEESRERVAGALGARPSEVVFTGGGTEADNLAVKGIYWARRAADPRRTRLVVSSVEHHAVLDAVQWLVEFAGAEVDWLPVDASGRVEVEALERALARHGDEIALVTVMLANNEVGTVQPIPTIARLARPHGIPVHTDAVQAVGQLPVDFADLGVDAMTVSGHKVGGPPGVGALVLRRELTVTPLLHGGGQERDVRSGTFNTPAIASFATAVDRAVAERETHAKTLDGLRDKLIDRVLAAVPDAELNGVREGTPDHRMPGIAHFTFPGCEGDSLLLLLDAQGIECSTGSACSAGVAEPSHVLLAMGRDEQRARGSLRFSLGHTSTDAEVAALGSAIGTVVERARTAGLVNVRSTVGPTETEAGEH